MENFIYEGYLEDLSLCDRLIEYYSTAYKEPGKSIGGSMNKDYKDSTDALLTNIALKQEYICALQKLTEEYIKLYPACNLYSPWTIREAINIQHYAPGQGFKAWHTERTSVSQPYASRHLVFLTYLNDVTDGGGTEFQYQNLITTARKGKTLIWPVDWTHTHRGVVSPTQDKYIVTGWYSYIN